MRNVDRYFVCLGVLAGLGGLGIGLWMHFHESYALAEVHAHTNLIGWVTMTLFGLAYRSGMARKDAWAVAHLWVSGGAVASFPTGMVIVMLGGSAALVDIGAILTIASMALFAANVLRALCTEQDDPQNAGKERAAMTHGVAVDRWTSRPRIG